MKNDERTLVLRVPYRGDRAMLTDALGECMRDLEANHVHEAGLLLDPDDPGRYQWFFDPEETE